MRTTRDSLLSTRGYAMAALLVGIAVLSVMTSIALPSWQTFVKREKEEELIFRGEQYVRAIELYQRKFANAYPPSVDLLVQQKFLRRKFKDPMTADGEFQLLYQTMAAPGRGGGRGAGAPQGGGVTGSPGEIAEVPAAPAFGAQSSPLGGQTAGPRGGVVGVVSKSTEASIRMYNGRTHYHEWQFVLSQSGPAGRGAAQPGVIPGRQGGAEWPGQPQPGRGRGSPTRPPGDGR